MRNYPLRIALIYFLTASLWIFLSDAITQQLVPARFLTAAQTIKGFAFVIVTAAVLFLITRYNYRHIQRNEREYRRLFKDNPHPMYVFDIETMRFLTVNDAAVEKYKYSQEEFRSMRITDIRPESERDTVLMFLKRIEDKAYHESGIWRHRDKNGRLFYVRIVSHASVFENHKVRVVLAIDVNEQIEAEKKVQLSESKLKGLINNTDDLIWMIDKGGLVVTANESFREKFRDATGAEVEISKKINVAKLPETWFIKNWNIYIRKAFAGEKLTIEQDIETRGKKECFEIILNPVHNDAGDVLYVGCFARDITQRKLTESQIKEQVNKLKQVAWIQSHEVRKPLANIMGLLELLKEEHDSRQSETLIDHMDASCKELDVLIKRIVETSSTGNSPSTQA